MIGSPDSRVTPERDRLIDPPEQVRASNTPGNRTELFVFAVVTGLAVGVVVLAVFTRKHLFARQIAPVDSPIQVM